MRIHKEIRGEHPNLKGMKLVKRIRQAFRQRMGFIPLAHTKGPTKKGNNRGCFRPAGSNIKFPNGR